MATNLRFETSTSSSDGGAVFTGIQNGHRSMDRSGSFRESHGSSSDTVVPLTQVLSLEPIVLGEQKYAKQVELRRVTNAVTGAGEDCSLVKPLDCLGAEELKKVRSSISETSSRARERVRHLVDAIQKLDKFRSSLQGKKRSKPDTMSERGASDRSNLKVVSQPDSIKPAEKTKSLVPNKRLRTSIADVRDGVRPNSVPTKKSSDRESPRAEDTSKREVWDKSKLKGRRSAIKSDAVPTAGNGVLEGDRDHKWSSSQHRSSQEARPRPSETHGLRSGPVHGVTSIHKAEASSQMNGSTSGDKVDRYTNVDKERMPKNGVRPSLEDMQHTVTGTSTVTKVKAARAPRSGTVGSTHLSHFNRTSALGVEKPQNSSKPQLPSGQNPGNRKRPASRSSSPVSVAQWVGQRPQKMARVARRVNIPPGGALPVTDEASNVSEAMQDRDPSVMRYSTSNGVLGVPRRLPSASVHSPAHSKARSERMTSSVVMSESEESEEASESKAKEKGKKGEWPDTNYKIVPKKASLYKEEAGDGVRRQGRSGRNFSMPKPVVASTLEKSDVATSTAKQLRSARNDKSERPGRTPTKKSSTVDRKALARIRRPPAGNSPAEIGSLLESEDDHEELLTAVRHAVEASATACSSSEFWKEVEPYFAFLTADDLAYLRQLADSKWCNEVASTPMNDATQKLTHLGNGNALEGNGNISEGEVRTGGRGSGGGGWYDKIYPLSQRLLAALINEGDDEDAKSSKGTDTGVRDGYSNTPDGIFQSNGNATEDLGDADDILADVSASKNEVYLTSAWDSQCERMSLDDRILLELQSIGLDVEQVPDLSQRDEDEISVEIGKLQDQLKDQVRLNRQQVDTLEKCVMAKREEELRDRERLGVSKLVEIAYNRRKGVRGSSGGAGGKGNKGARAAALALTKRALARVKNFEASQSCFVDPHLRDILFCNQPKSNDTNTGGNSVDTSATPAVSETSIPKSTEQAPSARVVLRRTNSKDKSLAEGELKSAWKDREVSSSEATSLRNTVSFGGVKGKRSERERDGKGQQGKEGHRKNDINQRQTVSTIKGERKTKTKPRHKTAPLFKDVNGLGKPTEAPKEKVAPPSVPLDEGISGVITDPALDLTHLAIPEDLGVHDETQDIGAWLALEDTALQDHGEFLMGLDVPMDDLSDLGMMM